MASLLSYEFHGTVVGGSTLDLGAGSVDISGASFVVTGSTLNDIDLWDGGAIGDGTGQFAATSTYDFGAFGSFTSDVGGDYYLQAFGGSPLEVSGSGLVDLIDILGFVGLFSPAVAGDADFGIVTGIHTPIVNGFGNPRTITNASGQVLTLYFDSSSISYMNITAVPEPTALALLLLGLFGLGFNKRKRI